MVTEMKIFISSTYIDLKDYREVVHKSILSLGVLAEDMLYWPADDRRADVHSVDRAKEADLLILILAHRYGYIPENSSYSITEMEYRAALEAEVPVLAFFVDETIPWPPAYIEYDKQDELAAFKALVSSQHTIKSFQSQDELARLVNEALVYFLQTKPTTETKTLAQRRFPAYATVFDIKSHVDIKTIPDLVIRIGRSLDKLPLFLKIHRSNDVAEYIRRINQIDYSVLQNSFPDSLLADLRDDLEREKRLYTVRMRDDTERTLYVSKHNLVDLFESLLTIVFRQVRVDGHLPGTIAATGTQSGGTMTPQRTGQEHKAGISIARGRLESVGGKNRYLGISPADGNLYSVGLKNGTWVEWRPFIFESFPQQFALAQYEIDAQHTGALEQFESDLFAYALDHVTPDGFVNANARFVISRQSIGHIVLEIARTLKLLQDEGFVHGDLKPSNVLLTETEPQLIDMFLLSVGEISPGWSQYWSAPEQILGKAVQPTTDIYPLGKMLADLLSGHLVGEVKKFRTPPVAGWSGEFDIFFNPSIYIDDSYRRELGTTAPPWQRLIQRCLRFDPQKRLTLDEFIGQLDALLNEHPLPGVIYLPLGGELVAANMVNGESVVGRLLSDEDGRPAANTAFDDGVGTNVYEYEQIRHSTQVHYGVDDDGEQDEDEDSVHDTR